MQIKIGADPELFIKGNSGKYISAHGVVPGTKEEPFPVDRGAVQVDGMALEFNIDPADTLDDFKFNVNRVMGILEDMLPEGFNIDAVPTAHFSKECMAMQPEEALELGCEPDYNAYTGLANTPPDGNVDFRTGAGHIHIGWTEGEDITCPDHLEACMMLVKQLDVALGVPSMLWDTDTKRRKLYGRAGAFRPKSYGVEYRVLSNKWLTNTRIMDYVYEATIKAFEDLVAGTAYYKQVDADNIINDNKQDHVSYYINNFCKRYFLGTCKEDFKKMGEPKKPFPDLSKMGVVNNDEHEKFTALKMGTFGYNANPYKL